MTPKVSAPDESKSPPLAGLRVLELGQIYCVPYCGFLLARLGADVVKVEPPDGDLIRHRTDPSIEPIPHTLLNANKRGLRLNLKLESGKQILQELSLQADILIENFASGVMDRLGVGYSELHSLNPQLVYGSATGFGSSGQYSKFVAMDLTVQAMTGVMAVNGFPESPPVKSGVAVADFMGGTHLTAGVIAAIVQRNLTGHGQHVEVSMQDALLPTLASSISSYVTRGADYIPRTGNRHGSLSVSPYNVYAASDGFVAILCASDRHWGKLCEVMEEPDLASDVALSTMRDRASRNDWVDTRVGAWAEQHSRSEIVDQLSRAGVPVAPVQDVGEVLRDPHLRQRGMLQEHEWNGHQRWAFGSPLQFSDSAPVPPSPSPTLGQDSDAILRFQLGKTQAEIEALHAAQVI